MCGLPQHTDHHEHTFLIYLDDVAVTDGGATFFPNCGNLMIQSKRGRVLWMRNVLNVLPPHHPSLTTTTNPTTTPVTLAVSMDDFKNVCEIKCAITGIINKELLHEALPTIKGRKRIIQCQDHHLLSSSSVS